jgi:ceramidase
MNSPAKIICLVLLSMIAALAVFHHTPIAQDLAYHDLADKRIVLGIPNGWNVLSNIPFAIVGLLGLIRLGKGNIAGTLNGTNDVNVTNDTETTKAMKVMKSMYAILFAGVCLVGLGSAYYHFAPGNNTLMYDRLPMTIAFMALLSIIIAEHINVKAGIRLLLPLLAIGIGSVVYWHYTELAGYGDLRLYVLVQYYPIIFIPLILLLFPAPAFNPGIRQLIGVILLYAAAKIFEYFDKQIFALTGFISGHTLKHLAAAAATWWLVRMYEKNYGI